MNLKINKSSEITHIQMDAQAMHEHNDKVLAEMAEHSEANPWNGHVKITIHLEPISVEGATLNTWLTTYFLK